jgi:LPS export ABC transporter permease LptG
VILAWIFALGNALWLAPRSAARLVQLQNSLRNAQISFAVQPRVFYENFKDKVLYVQDASTAEGAAAWNDVFLADISDPSAPAITMSEHAVIIPEDQNTLRLHLEDGEQHQTRVSEPEQYNITTFQQSDVPIELPNPTTQQKQREAAAAEMTTPELLARSNDPDLSKARWFQTEFQRRLALPTSCLVLALVGIPLGLSSRKGGKATGFVLAIALVFAYYLISLSGVAMSRQGKLPAWVAVWIANIVFGLAGILLLHRVDRSSLEIGSVHALVAPVMAFFRRRPQQGVERRAPIRVQREIDGASRFPSLLDNYVLRNFLLYVGLVLAAFVLLTTVFTFFELLGDIIRNRASLVMVGEYLVNVIPSLIYQTTPLSVLVGVLVTFSILQSSNELTAIKASGVSVYRVVLPVLLISMGIAAALFLFDQFYLPSANTKQESIRNAIKGKPPQTFVRPDRKWIFGKNNVIYYYEHFEPELNEFVGISAFEFDPKNFKIVRRAYASRAHWEPNLQNWVFERGWWRTFSPGGGEDFKQFDVTTFAQFNEQPGYFKKEVKQSSEMSYGELARYINDLKQSGFETVRLQVQLHKKFAYPMICFVMAVLAVPFSLRAGRRGALTGVAVALGIAVVYWVTSGLFEALGNVSQLPAALAAWAPDVLFGLVGGYLIFKVPT